MLAQGTIIGGIRIGNLLGRGGMGEVYSAEQISLKRPVAVKRIAEHLLDNAHAVTRFEREARIVAKIQNQHVLHVHDFGRFADPHGQYHYLLIMELIQDGRSLSSLLGAPLDWRLASSLILQTAEGLAAAAELGVVHRDIKPENIMLTHKGVAKLGDFGLARSVDSSSVSMGSLVGTPDYMAPEACRGDLVDSRSDIYSLGCTWYELLCGRTPFHDAVNVMAVLHCHIAEEPKDIRSYGLDLPAPISALVHRCMAKDPQQRPQSPQQLINDILALSAEGIVLAHTVPALLPVRPISTTDPTTSLTNIAAPNGIEAASAPTIITGASAAKPRKLAFRAFLTSFACLLGLCFIVLILSQVAGDPLATKRALISEARDRGELDLAIQRAQALIAEYPASQEALAELRVTFMAKIHQLSVAGRYTDASQLIGRYRDNYPELADAADRAARLHQANELIQDEKFDEAAKVFIALRASYPRDLDLCRIIIDTMAEHENRDGFVRRAAYTIIKQGDGPIEPKVVDVALYTLKNFPYDGAFISDLRREVCRRDKSLALRFKPLLTDESEDVRINAFVFLKEAGQLTEDEEFKHHFFIFINTTQTSELEKAVEYFVKAIETPDWQERKKQAGVGKITAIPSVKVLWQSHADLLYNVLAKGFLPEIEAALPVWLADKDEALRDHAWRIVKAAKMTERIDLWSVHSTTLTTFTTCTEQPMFHDALDFCAGKSGTAESAKALALLEQCRQYVEKEAGRYERSGLDGHAYAARKCLPQIEAAAAKLRTAP
jgi:tRNA A-37 threonylcarbamoyl transferase component Bud32